MTKADVLGMKSIQPSVCFGYPREKVSPPIIIENLQGNCPLSTYQTVIKKNQC